MRAGRKTTKVSCHICFSNSNLDAFQVSELRLRLVNLPAPRPAIIFWRQAVNQRTQKEMLEEALIEQENVTPLFQGLREKAPNSFKELSQRRWEAISAEMKERFEESAREEEANFLESKVRLEREMHGLGDELKALRQTKDTGGYHESETGFRGG